MKSEMSNRLSRQHQSVAALAIISFVFLFASVARAATFHVTTTADNNNNANPTAGSLRKAIIDANANPGMDTIDFNIPGAGVHTISLVSLLPTITDPVVIDGYTQPGASANTLANGDNAVLLIQLTGTNVFNFSAFEGLVITAGGSTVKGLIINGFYNSSTNFGNAIRLTTKGGNVISGNFIGTNSNGTAKIPSRDGVLIDGSPNNVIGGSTPALRNLISGNSIGIEIGNAGATGNLIHGNFIGTDHNGTGALGNNDGVLVGSIGQTLTNLEIGATLPGTGNVISANTYGIEVAGSLSGLLIRGNMVGTDVTGKVALANTESGIAIFNSASPLPIVVGGNTAAARNVISGNKKIGVWISNSTGVVIQGNYIGTDITGKAALGNEYEGVKFDNGGFHQLGGVGAGEGNVISASGLSGVEISKSNGNFVQRNLIGLGADGTTALGNAIGIDMNSSASNNVIGGQGNGGNFIAFNGYGVTVHGDNSTGNQISSNSITSNASLGIDLAPISVVNPNHTGSAVGPNNLQNYPVLTRAALISNGLTYISGTLNSTANTKFRIELFANKAFKAGGYGEGQTFLGGFDATTDASGNLSFNSGGYLNLSLGQYISATAIDPAGNTSEFSQNKQVAADGPGSLQFSSAAYSVNENGGQATITVKRTGGSFGTDTIQYTTVAGGTATAGTDYTPVSGTLIWGDGDSSDKTFTVPVIDDSITEQDETLNLALSNPTNGAALGSPGTAVLTIKDNDAQQQQTTNVQIEQTSYSVSEGDHFKLINITRTGDTSTDVSVDYTTSDGTAGQRTDYTLMLGTLHFAPSETTKTLTFLVTEDSYVEGNETLTLSLSNATGATLGSQSQAQITILDNDNNQNAPNAITDTQNFVRQQYHDFLNREPDAAGFAGWQDILNKCAPGDTSCDRIEVSSAFYRSQEFHDRGYFIYRFYSASLGRTPKYQEFMRDMQKVSGFLSAQQQEQAKLDFINEFMARPEFQQKYGQINGNGNFADAVLNTAGVSLPQTDPLVPQLGNNQLTRGQILRLIIECPQVDQKFNNEGFVVMQYFGYLRRDPDILYQQWVQTLSQSNDYRILVNGFMNSLEYVLRFGK
jgi:hypothetical protein